jgi:predicted transcriptional regulator YheO
MMTNPPSQTSKPQFEALSRVALALQRLFHPLCEVVIHDFDDLEHSIVFIAGNLTDRSVGGAATDLLLACVKHGDTDKDLDSYLTSLPSGRIMKSSTIFLRDEAGYAYGAFCVNVDVTAFITFRKQLGAFLTVEEKGEVSELFSDDIRETIEAMIAETMYEIGDRQPLISRESKVKLVARLSEKGAFQVKKAVPIVADLLGLSRATVYNYLREAGHERGNDKPL